MLQVSKIIPQGAGLAAVLVKRASSMTLDWQVRQKSRFNSTDSLGRMLNICLTTGTVVRGGDVLLTEDGALIKVIAAPQAVLRITHCANHGAPCDLLRAAYSLGKRQVPTEIRPDHLKILPDQILAEMLSAMHFIVHEVNEAFEPDGNSYGTVDTARDDEHAQASSARPAMQPAHVHGPDCKHDHGHNHADTTKPVAIQIHKFKPRSH